MEHPSTADKDAAAEQHTKRRPRPNTSKPRRSGKPGGTSAHDLQQQVDRLTQALAAQRARADDLNRRLGYALLTAGRLRGQLRQNGLEPDVRFAAELSST